MGRILRIANSVFYRRPIPAKTLEQVAVVRLGLGLVRDLAISLSTQYQAKNLSARNPDVGTFDRCRQQLHSLSLAIRETSTRVKLSSLTAHDTGKVLLNNHAPGGPRNAVVTGAHERVEALALSNARNLADHTVVGGLMLKSGNSQRRLSSRRSGTIWPMNSIWSQPILAPLLQPSLVMTLRIRLA